MSSFSRIAVILRDGLPGQTVDVRGWVRTKRESKGEFAFLEVNDGSCFGNLQLVVDGNVPDYASLMKEIGTGASIHAVGEVKESPGKGQRIEVHVRSLRVLGTADPATYPLQKKGHSFEFLREKRTCGRGRTRSERWPACGMPSVSPSTSSTSRAAFSTSIRR